MDKKQLREEAIKVAQLNNDMTLIDELVLELPEEDRKNFFKYKLIEDKELTEILRQNKIKIKRALKVQLYKAGTTQSMLELNKILENEENNDKISSYIDEIAERWKNEL